MKRFKLTAAAALILIFMCGIGARAEEARVNLCVSDTFLGDDAYAITQNDTTLVPIRIINDILGFETEWDGDTKCVSVNFGDGRSCNMYIDKTVAFVTENGTRRRCELEMPPRIISINGEPRTVVPARFIAEEAGLDVRWEPVGSMVFINSAAAYESYPNSERYRSVLIRENAPEALMSSGSLTEYVPVGEINERRRSGWVIKDYTYGLDGLAAQLKGYISGKNGSWGVYINDLNTGKFAVINDGQYSSASVIKLFIMASVYNEISYGSIEKTPRVSDLLTKMITQSDNYSSNALVKIIGGGDYKKGFDGENANTYSIGALNTQHNSLFIGYGDYVSYGRNLVSPLDCGIALEKIYKGELVSEEYSAEMLALLKGQQRRWKIPYPLPRETVTANKTGETSTVESDVAIVYSPACDYIICVLTNNAPDGIAGIRKISQMTYDYFNADS